MQRQPAPIPTPLDSRNAARCEGHQIADPSPVATKSPPKSRAVTIRRAVIALALTGVTELAVTYVEGLPVKMGIKMLAAVVKAVLG